MFSSVEKQLEAIKKEKYDIINNFSKTPIALMKKRLNKLWKTQGLKVSLDGCRKHEVGKHLIQALNMEIKNLESKVKESR